MKAKLEKSLENFLECKEGSGLKLGRSRTSERRIGCVPIHYRRATCTTRCIFGRVQRTLASLRPKGTEYRVVADVVRFELVLRTLILRAEPSQ